MASRKFKFLTEKQRQFVAAYCDLGSPTTGNIRRSAIAAGYKEKNADVVGWNLMQNPKVKAEVEKLLNERREIEKASREYHNKVLYDIIAAGHKKIEEATVSDSLKALQELAKRNGEYAATKQEVTNVNIETTNHKLSAEDALKELEKIKEAILQNSKNMEELKIENIKKVDLN